MMRSTGSGEAPALCAQSAATRAIRSGRRIAREGYFRLHSAAVSKVCASCGKKPSFGNNRSHSMVATKRRFNPNLQRVRVLLNGVARRAYVCTKCLMAGKGLKRLLARDRLTQGIGVTGTPDGVRIDLHVVVEYGLNLAEVAATVRSRVAYEVERLTGLPVAAVEVHIEDVRKSA